MRQKDRLTFTRQAEEFILSLGGRKSPDQLYTLQLDTPIGPLYLAPTADYSPVLFTRWQDPVAARQHGIDCNRFSGKWNTHFPNGWAVAECLDTIRRVLTHTLRGLEISQESPEKTALTH